MERISTLHVPLEKILKDTQHNVQHTLIKAQIQSMNDKHAQLSTGQVLSLNCYDMVLICTGSYYDMSIVPHIVKDEQHNSIVIDTTNSQEYVKHFASIEAAKSIAVVGTGGVGVEIAGIW